MWAFGFEHSDEHSKTVGHFLLNEVSGYQIREGKGVDPSAEVYLRGGQTIQINAADVYRLYLALRNHGYFALCPESESPAPARPAADTIA